ncbi:hypothetical protein C8D87_114117 [Lentzea atacamensis]|uniref:Uncharacterized protein n=1 Tax=Lentzea atacamensis TaxID=531938 RepID=A0ABX9DW37_9PSEU|nr:hypothetical protein [Lentzea atacamensis]RAS59505.1 hypothetical protein C8D87_114117 [Lentzea atacamensis]
MPVVMELASKPFPVEDLRGPNLIPVVVVVIFVVIWVCWLFKS